MSAAGSDTGISGWGALTIPNDTTPMSIAMRWPRVPKNVIMYEYTPRSFIGLTRCAGWGLVAYILLSTLYYGGKHADACFVYQVSFVRA